MEAAKRPEGISYLSWFKTEVIEVISLESSIGCQFSLLLHLMFVGARVAQMV